MLLEDLWEAICVEFPPPPPPLPFLALEAAMHASFVAVRAHTFVGRRDCLTALLDFALGSRVGPQTSVRPLVVVGRSGIGKTSLVLTFAHRLRARGESSDGMGSSGGVVVEELGAQSDGEDSDGGKTAGSGAGDDTADGTDTQLTSAQHLQHLHQDPSMDSTMDDTFGIPQHNAAVVALSLRASPGSRDLRSLLLLLCRSLHEVLPTLDADMPEDMDINAVKDAWRGVLAAAGEEALALSKRVIVVVDSVNAVAPFGSALSMDWWPSVMPPGVIGIVSTTPESLCYASLHSRDPPPHELSVESMGMDTRSTLVEARLKLCVGVGLSW